MTHVVTESCIQCKYTDCVTVCPVDCFHEGPNFLVIDPCECIDCTLCVAECPVDAIFRDVDMPDGSEEYLELNAQLAQIWPVIIQKKAALPEAERWRHVMPKREFLDMGANDDMDPLLKPQTPMHEQERTPEFTEATAPKGLQHNHRVKAGVWGRLTVLEGALRYCLEDGSGRHWVLRADDSVWIPPDVPHRVEFMGPTRFYLSFWH